MGIADREFFQLGFLGGGGAGKWPTGMIITFYKIVQFLIHPLTS